jgi:glycosyltransferase involved in cell wall biosynthesis
VLPSETGLLVPSEDVDALVEALEVLIHDRNLRRSMGKRARIHMEDNFDQESINEKSIAVYHRALTQKSLPQY